MTILALIDLLAQIYFAVHAIKTGKDWYWVYIIILFPGVGCLIYFFAEYLPEIQRGRGVRNILSALEDKLFPGKRLKAIEEQAEMTPSINNKKTLAEAYINEKMFDKAIEVYQNLLKDGVDNDLSILEGLCCANFFKGDYVQAKKNLNGLMELRGSKKGDEFDILLAQTFEMMGDVSRALKQYSEILPISSGEEARCRYGLLLKKTGNNKEAKEQFDTIIKNCRVSPNYYKRAQKKWLDIAKKEIVS